METQKEEKDSGDPKVKNQRKRDEESMPRKVDDNINKMRQVYPRPLIQSIAYVFKKHAKN